MIEDRISKEIINGNIKIQKLGDKKVIFKGKIIEEYRCSNALLMHKNVLKSKTNV